MSHIFISYSRKDLATAQKIVDALAANDLDTWIDWKSIPKGEDWEQEIYRGIESADAFLFLMSPASVVSEMCNKEIAHAVENGKRILPIFIANVDNRQVYAITENFLSQKQKDEINRRNFIFCREERDDFYKAIEEIRTTLHTDYDWLKYHTKLQIKALDWERTKDNSRLLRGKELHEAEEQLTESHQNPHATELQRNYLLNSRRNEERQRRQIIFGLGFGLVVVAFLAIFAWGQRNSAIVSEEAAIAEANEKATALKNEESARATAQAEKERAEEQATIARASELAALSASKIGKNPTQATLLALEGYKTKDDARTRSGMLNVLKEYEKIISTLHGHTQGISGLAFSPDGNLLASSEAHMVFNSQSLDDPNLFDWNSTIETVVLWDISNPVQPVKLAALFGHNLDVLSVAFSPNGTLLASGSEDTTIILWDLSNPTSPTPVSRLFGHSYCVDTVVFSTDGNILASGSWDKTIILWDVSDPYRPTQLSMVNKENSWVRFSPNGRILVSGSDDDINIWDLSDPKTPLKISTIFGDGSYVRSVAFSPDGKILASGDDDSNVTLWNVLYPNAPTLLATLSKHVGYVTGLAFSPNEKSLFSSSNDNTVIMWDISIPSEPTQVSAFHSYSAGISSISLSTDGAVLASGNDDGVIVLWNTSELGDNGFSTTLSLNIADVYKVTFSPDEKKLASCGSDDVTTLWDMSTLVPIQNSTLPGCNIFFSPDGKVLATITCNWVVVGEGNFCEHQIITLWDVSSLSAPFQLARLTEFTNAVTDIAFHPHNPIMVSAENTDHGEGRIILWDVSNPNTPTQLSVLGSEFVGRVIDVSFSPDGNSLAMLNDDISFALWDITNPLNPTSFGTSLDFTMQGFSDGKIDFSANGEKLVVSRDDGSFMLWDVSNLSSPAQLSARMVAGDFLPGTRPTVNVKFSPEGKTMASAMYNNITIWDILDPVAPSQIIAFSEGINILADSLIFSVDGLSLASANYNGLITLWTLNPRNWLLKVCQISGRNFTQAEWQQYFPGEEYRITCPHWPAGE